MIFLDDNWNFPRHEVEKVTVDYLSFVGKPHLPTCSERGWDYVAIMTNGNFCETDITLDIGCAVSYFALYLTRFVAVSHGIDALQNGGFDYLAQPWLETLVDFDCYGDGRFVFHDQNAASLPFRDGYFDKIITVSAMEHFRDEDDILCSKEVARVLKPGGLFLGTVDFNAATERPKCSNGSRHAYTYEAFMRRIVKPSGLSLVGKDFLANQPVPETVDYLAEAMFFCLQKVEMDE